MPDRDLHHAVVRHALARVAWPGREVLVQHDVSERTMPDIAASLGIPVNTGYARLRRARTMLRHALDDLGHEQT